MRIAHVLYTDTIATATTRRGGGAMIPYLKQPVEARLRLLENTPIELRQRDQWVGFQLKPDSGRVNKIPCIAPDGVRKASSTRRDTWRSFAVATEGLHRGRYGAIAYALDDDFFAIDLDHCLTDDRTPEAYAAAVLAKVKTYTEVSVSGRGLHLFGQGQIQRSIRSKLLEVYGRDRFIIVTGEPFRNATQDLRQFSPDEVAEAMELIDAGREQHIASNSLISSNDSNLSDFSDLSNNQIEIDRIVARTLPRAEGERNHRVFDLARGLKFDLGMADHPLPELKPIVRKWHRQALPVIGTKPFDDTWADFTTAWEKAHTPLSANALAIAINRAAGRNPPPEAEQYDSLPVRTLIAVCRELQDLNKPRPFYLSSYKAAELMGITQQGAWKVLQMLAADGVIQVASHGIRQRSNRYFYGRPAEGQELAPITTTIARKP